MEQEVLEGFHLSPQQKHLWALQQADTGLLQRACCTIQIDGGLNLGLLEQTLQTLAARHEILRTAFRYLPEMSLPLQVVTESGIELAETVDWTQDTAAEQEAKIEALLRKLVGEPAQVAHGPFVSATPVRLASDRHLLFLAMPSLYADAATFRNLIEEISWLYEAQEQEAEVEEAIQFIDLSEWQNELLEAEEGEPGRVFWHKQALLKRVVSLPFARKAAEQHPFTPCTVSVTFPDAFTAELQSLAQRYDTSADLLLLTCWQVLLWRLTEQPDIVVGMAFDGRKYEELEQALGLFAKHLPLHTTLETGRTFEQALQSTVEAVSEAYDYEEFFSWEQLSTPSQNGSGLPFMPVCFSYVDWPQPFSGSGLIFSLGRYAAHFDRFQLNLTCTRREQSLSAAFVYDANHFRPEDIASLAEQFQTLAQAVTAAPDTPIDELPLLTADERQRLLYDFNNTTQDFPQDTSIHRLFEAQVDRTPENTALVCGEQSLTYAELDRRANQLAHHLQSLGIKLNTIVGIGLNHAVETVVGILGVLKSGGIYLPLDPAYPKERLAFMLADAGAAFVLTTQDLLDVYPVDERLNILCLDSEWETIARQPETRPVSGIEAQGLAYLIYTSGSTGQPKGTKISHRSLVNYIWWAKSVYLRGEPANFSLYSSLAFDLTVTSIYTPLVSGSTLVIYNIPGSDIAAILEDNQTGILKLTPSHLSLIRDRDNSRSTIKRLIVGGEALETALTRQIYESFGGQVEIFNEYGPTEATVGCMIYQFDMERDADRPFVPIGKPAANTQIYLLDEQMQPVARNVAGEIYIGGAGVAEGYLNRPNLTEARFVPDPFYPGSKLYRTGDFGRLSADGNMVFIGRRDDQVKFHGYRVELNEIRAALKRHAQIEDGVAVIAEDSHGHSVLVAYYIADQEIESDELRAFLGQHLIEETIPNFFVRIEHIPLTPNGKVDPKKLPTLSEIRQKARRKYVAPRTETEEVLVGIWEKILETERVGIHDDFFALGGHSLLGTQIMARIQTVFEVELPLRTLFNAPTAALMAQQVDEALQTGAEGGMPPLKPIGREEELPLSFAQQRLWFIDQLSPGTTAYNIPTAVRFRGWLNVADVERVINQIVQRHEVLRTTFVSIEGVPYQRIAPQRFLPLPVINLAGLPPVKQEREMHRLVKEEAWRPFDLEAGPMLRTTFLKLAEDDHILLLTMHHIISDGWSTGIFIQEIISFARALDLGEEPELPALPVQYADFAYWQREWLQGETLEKHLAYWRERFSEPPPVLDLPTDRPRPKSPSGRGASEVVRFSADLQNQLNQLSLENGVTLFMTLLAAFKVLLFHYTRQTDLVVGTPVAGRDRVDIENLIGFFVNTLALRTDLSNQPTFLEFLEQVREVSLDAHAHQGLPFEKLVEKLDVVRDMSYTPLFQAMFVLQNAPQTALNLPDLTVEVLDFQQTTAKFDLTLAMMESEDGLVASIGYNTDIFEGDTIRRMLAHFQMLLEGIVAQPGRQISHLPLLSKEEVQELLYDLNPVWSQPFPDKCLHEWFENQVEATPDAIAITCGSEKLTYQALNQRANQLAHYLQTYEVQPNNLIGIYAERSIEMIVAILGILKAGAAYLPLEQAYPPDRLAFMLEDAQVSLVLTQANLVEQLPSGDFQTVRLDRDWEDIAVQPDVSPNITVTPQNLAYVIYTSGSTGRPKGVLITHENVTRLFTATAPWFGFNEEDVWTLFHSVAFDFSVWEIWGALLYGGRLVIVPYWVSRSFDEFYQLLQTEGVTVLNQTPSAFYQVIQAAENAGNRGELPLRYVIFGGEALDLARLKPWVRQYGDKSPQLVNMYGITETTVHVTYCPLEEAMLDTSGSLIGRPIPDLQLYILDEQMQPVPVGVPGELYVGGAGVASGYLNRPELTAARFIPNPFAKTQPPSLLYKSGDLARYLPDGNIEYLGRIDHQVKIRGFRIELGEIQAALNSHPAVQESLVLAYGDAPDRRQLLAYLVFAEKEPTIDELRTFLQQILPDYMIPAVFVSLESLPLTPNGKIDRRALPAPGRGDLLQEQEFVAPSTPAEQMMAEIWIDVLGVERVGIHDNFFFLGGHSLLATQIIARAQTIFGVQLPLQLLFESPTIAGLVSAVLREQATQTEDEALWTMLAELEELPDSELEALLMAEEQLLAIEQEMEAGK